MPQTTGTQRLTREIETTDDYFVLGDSIFHHETSADPILENGAESVTEPEIMGLTADAIKTLHENDKRLTVTDFGILIEAYKRAKYYGELPYSDRHDQFIELMDVAKNTLWNGHEMSFTDAIPSYTHTEGVPSSVGAVTTRLLPDWVVELTIMSEEDAQKRDPDLHTVTAEVVSDFSFSGEPVGFGGQFYDDFAWKLEGIGDDEGHTFALAPIEEGEDTTLWVKDSFTSNYNSRYAVVGITTYPNKKVYRDEN